MIVLPFTVRTLCPSAADAKAMAARVMQKLRMNLVQFRILLRRTEMSLLYDAPSRQLEAPDAEIFTGLCPLCSLW
jgi:hypothetical protein